MTRGVFVTGTDTGVGKTHVAAALAYLLATRGERVRARKPVESGCTRIAGELFPLDGSALREAAGAWEPLRSVCPHRLEAPLSPDRAAQMEEVTLDLAQLLTACGEGEAAGDFLLVEGAGGFCSPLTATELNAHLAVALGLPVLLVTSDRLGAIHQALATAEAIGRRGLTLAGVVLNQIQSAPDPRMDNAEALARWLGVGVTVVPHGSMDGNEGWEQTARCLGGVADLLAPETMPEPL